MLTLPQLQNLAASGESETLEFKRSTAELKSAMQTLSAFLNHRGGCLLFGVEDDGRIVGQTTAASTLHDIAQEIKRFEPSIQPEISLTPVSDTHNVIAITVGKSAVRPCTYNGKAYKRIGNTTSELSIHEYSQMLFEHMHATQRWENQPVENWTLDMLDHNEILITVEEAIRRGRMEDPGTRDITQLLTGLNLIKDNALLRAAIVLFGKPTCFRTDFIQCLLRVARFQGNDKSEFLDNRQFRGNLFALLQHAEQFLRDNIPIAGHIPEDRMARIDTPKYPFIALRETLINALCHRDYTIGGGGVDVAIYADKLEITSAGILHFGLTPQQLYQPHSSRPWNPLIANALYRRGMIETWGRGTLKIVETTVNAGLPRPEIQEVAGSVTVVFTPIRPAAPQRTTRDLTERQQQILDLLASEGRHMPLREIVKALKLEKTPWVISEDLAALKTLGLVKSQGRGRGATWRVP